MGSFSDYCGYRTRQNFSLENSHKYYACSKVEKSQQFLIRAAGPVSVVASVRCCQSLANLDLLDINGDTSLSLQLSTSHEITTHRGRDGPKITVIGGNVRKTIVF